MAVQVLLALCEEQRSAPFGPGNQMNLSTSRVHLVDCSDPLVRVGWILREECALYIARHLQESARMRCIVHVCVPDLEATALAVCNGIDRCS